VSAAGARARFGGLFYAVPRAALLTFVLSTAGQAQAQDYAREARWAADTTATLLVGKAVRIEQKSGHRFLALYTASKTSPSKGAVIVAHGRGWGPDFELYGVLRTRLADAGYDTLSIQLPVLPSTAKIGDYLPLYGDSSERFALAAAWLRARGHSRVAIVSHSLGATMANQYLIRTPQPGVVAWVSLSIINGLEEMFRIQVPVLDVFGEHDWQVTRYGADERNAQISKVAGSAQVIIAKAEHFYEQQYDELLAAITTFLTRVLHQ
jgi:pimeloyl-ACP methyl ester carboxylesterase